MVISQFKDANELLSACHEFQTGSSGRVDARQVPFAAQSGLFPVDGFNRTPSGLR
jgi:hypothetical protein